MGDLYNRINQRPQGSADEAKVTAKQFLGKDENVQGYTNPEEYMAYLKSLRPGDVEHLSRFFGHAFNQVRLENHLQVRNDRGARAYRFPKFLLANATDGTKVILGAGMDQFLDDYANGLVRIDFTLEELVEELLNS